MVGSYRLVGIISGRPAAFLARHLRVDGLELWGSYGLEHVAGDGSIVVAPEARPWEPAVASVVALARRSAVSGLGIEDKGLSVTLHVRSAPHLAEWLREFAAAQAEATGLVVHEAKMSVELRPPLDVDKGSVVAGLLERVAGVTTACFVGDDRGDLSAFAALDGLDSAFRVAVRSAETPAELLAAADMTVDGPDGALEFLTALLP